MADAPEHARERATLEAGAMDPVRGFFLRAGPAAFLLLAFLWAYAQGLAPLHVRSLTVFPLLLAAGLGLTFYRARRGRFGAPVVLLVAGALAVAGAALALAFSPAWHLLDLRFGIVPYYGVVVLAFLAYGLVAVPGARMRSVALTGLVFVSIWVTVEFVLVNAFDLTARAYLPHYTHDILAQIASPGIHRVSGPLGNSSMTSVLIVALGTLTVAYSRRDGERPSMGALALGAAAFLMTFSGTGVAVLLVAGIITAGRRALLPAGATALGLAMLGAAIPFFAKVAPAYVVSVLAGNFSILAAFAQEAFSNPAMLFVGAARDRILYGPDLAYVQAVAIVGVWPLLILALITVASRRAFRRACHEPTARRAFDATLAALLIGTLHYPALFSVAGAAFLALVFADAMRTDEARALAAGGRPRVGYYMSSPMLGGAEQHLRDLLRKVDRARFEVTLFYDPWPEFERFVAPPPDVRLVPVRVREPAGRVRGQTAGGERAVVSAARERYRALSSPAGRFLVQCAYATWRLALAVPNGYRLGRALREHPVDVLHVENGGYPGADTARIMVVVARHVGVRRVVLTVHAEALPRRAPRWLAWLVDRSVARRSDAVLCVSSAVMSSLQRHRGIAGDHVRVLHNGVEDPRAPTAPPHEGLVVGMVAGFLPLKGHDVLLDAFLAARESRPEMRLLLVGSGPERERILARVAAEGLEGVVRAVPHVPKDEVWPLLAQMDVVVLPSRTEGFGIVLVEAMCLGKPVVATRVGGIVDVVEDGRNGILVEPDDAAGLARALERLAGDAGARAEMGKAGRARYHDRFTLEAMVRRHEAVYSGEGGAA